MKDFLRSVENTIMYNSLNQVGQLGIVKLKYCKIVDMQALAL